MVFPDTLHLQRLADKLVNVEQKRPRNAEPKPPLAAQEDPVWEKVLREICQFVPDVHDIGSSDLIRSVYSAGIQDVEVLKSLSALSISKSQEGQENYNQHIFTLAQCLAQGSLRKCSKLALIRTLMTLRSPLEVGWQLNSTVIGDTLQFITDREYVWEYLDHFDEILLWELRAITLREMERGNKEESVSRDNGEIEGRSDKFDEISEPKGSQALVPVQSTSGEGIHRTLTDRIQEVRERVIPNEEKGAVGQIGIGAAVLVSDMLIMSSGQLAIRRAAVALLQKSQAVGKDLAKATGKTQFLQMNDRCLLDEFDSESTSSSDESDIFAEPDEDMFQDEFVRDPIYWETQQQSCTAEGQEESNETSNGAAAPPSAHRQTNFDFGTKSDVPPSELHPSLPDQIAGVGPQSNNFSDITNEPVFEKARSYATELLRVASSRDIASSNQPKRALSDDEDCTACTVEETDVTTTNNTLFDPQIGRLLLDNDDAGFEKDYEA